MEIPRLIKNRPFSKEELEFLKKRLESLTDDQRLAYRNLNSNEIATTLVPEILIVSGPGTGKTTLFLKRIQHWLDSQPSATILVTSLVRKLVSELARDLENVEPKYRGKTGVWTLHKLARSIVEKNHGTVTYPFRPFFKIIGPGWKDMVWHDTCHLSKAKPTVYSWAKFEEQLHNGHFLKSKRWPILKQLFFKLCKYLNSAGFADLIIRATMAIKENPPLIAESKFIVDEYQDFNAAEDALIQQLTRGADGLLIVGDDDQVLYEKLRAGRPELIRNRYWRRDCLKAMLPFCGRSKYHITKAADHFINQQAHDRRRVKKIFLPLNTTEPSVPVSVVACATPSTAVDFIEHFIDVNKLSIVQRTKKLEEEKSGDPFLMILTPSKKLNFLKFRGSDRPKQRLLDLIAHYRPQSIHPCEDYYKAITYYSVSKRPNENFTFRKVFQYENVDGRLVQKLLEAGVSSDVNLADIEHPIVQAIKVKCESVRAVLESSNTSGDKVEGLSSLITIIDPVGLQRDIENKFKSDAVEDLEKIEEDEAELKEVDAQILAPVELLSIVGAKGLSADHVIMLGFDDVNMSHLSTNAFYVAMTRARESIHLLTTMKAGGAKRPHHYLSSLPDDNLAFYKYLSGGNRTQLTKNGFLEYLSRLAYMSSQQRHRPRT